MSTLAEAAPFEPYAHGRIYHDADAHIMESPDWLIDRADPGVRERLRPVFVKSVRPGEDEYIEHWRRKHRDPAERPQAEAEIMLRKNWSALGSFLREDRPRALDLLGFSSQLVFNTFSNQMLQRVEHGDDLGLAYGLAGAHNRAMLDFCYAHRLLLAP